MSPFVIYALRLQQRNILRRARKNVIDYNDLGTYRSIVARRMEWARSDYKWIVGLRIHGPLATLAIMDELQAKFDVIDPDGLTRKPVF